MAKILSPSTIRRQGRKKPRVRMGGTSGDAGNRTIGLADTLGATGRSANINDAIERRLMSLGVVFEFEEETYNGDVKVNDPGITEQPTFKGIEDFNRKDETSELQKIIGTSKMTKENVSVLSEAIVPFVPKGRTLVLDPPTGRQAPSTEELPEPDMGQGPAQTELG